MGIPKTGNLARWPVGVVAISDIAPQHRSVMCASASAVQLGAQANCYPQKEAP